MREHVELPFLVPDDANLHASMPDIDERHIQPLLLREIGLVNSISQRRGGRLMEQAQRAEARDGGGIGDSPSLQISEIRRDANAAIEDRGVEIALGDPLEVGEHHGEQLRGGERPVLPKVPCVDEREAVGALGDAEREGGEVALQLRVGEGAAEEALDLGDGVPRVHGGGRGPRGADEALLVAEADDGGGLPLRLLVEHHVDAPLPRHGDDAALIADVEPHHAHPR
ncbi:Os05g0181100, partial [Oryza sativa Japonica Group]